MNLYKFIVTITPIKENRKLYYQVKVPALPEIATFGESFEEAVFMAQDALELVVLSRLENGETIPQDKKSLRLPKSAVQKETIVSVVHNVSITTADHTKLALA